MKIEIMDQNVSLTMNVFLIIANIINLIYNIPQVVKTFKTKSTKDFSSSFLFLRVIGNIIWIGYAIEVDSFLMLTNNIVTVISSLFLGYYKTIEIYNENKENKKSKESKTNNYDLVNDNNDNGLIDITINEFNLDNIKLLN